MKEPNPFEDPIIAEQWVQSIETPNSRSREKEFYPLLYSWTKSLTPKVIIDLGCGQGICSSKIALFPEDKYIGIEPSDYLLKRAQKNYSESNKIFLKGDSYSIPVESKSVGAVFSVGVWFHVLNLDRAHAEVARVLQSGGEVMIFTANPLERAVWETWFENPRKEGKTTEGKVKVPGSVLDNNIFYFHSTEEIINSLQKFGFKDVSIQEAGFGGGERKEAVWIIIKAVKA